MQIQSIADSMNTLNLSINQCENEFTQCAINVCQFSMNIVIFMT